MQATAQQEAIVADAIAGSNLAIEALAGTGKTSTQVMVGNALSHKRGRYLAFNKAIADEANSKFGNNVIASTIHSLAFRAVGRQYAHRLEGPKSGGSFTPMRILQDQGYTSMAGIMPLSRAGMVKKVLTNYMANTRPAPAKEDVPFSDLLRMSVGAKWTPADIDAIADALVMDACTLLEDILADNSELPYPHSLYLKQWADRKPSLGSELLLVDEAQDLDPLMARLVMDQDAQIVLVGDSRQMVYEWRGAQNLINTLTDSVELNTHYLTQSFRFGNRIAAAANHVLSHLNSPVKMTGTDIDRRALPQTRAMLYRTNGGVFGELVERSLDKEEKVHVAGGTADLAILLGAVEKLKRGVPTPHPDFIGFESWEQYEEAAEAYNAPPEMRLLVKVTRKHPMGKLKEAVAQAKHVTEQEADITLSTAHKAKGREFAHVALGKDFTLPSDNPLLDSDENRIPLEEARLQYVAMTRAQVDLYGAKSLIDTYRKREEIQKEIEAVAGASVEERLKVKMRYAPSIREEDAFEAFLKNLDPDERDTLVGTRENTASKSQPSP